jgi:hypothetical protein
MGREACRRIVLPVGLKKIRPFENENLIDKFHDPVHERSHRPDPDGYLDHAWPYFQETGDFFV